MKRIGRRACISLGFFALGIFALIYSGPGRAFVRGTLGDTAATGFLVAALPSSLRVRIVLVASLALCIELSQLAAPANPGLLRTLLLGSRFDFWDLVSYGVGIALAASIELLLTPRDEAQEPADKAPDATSRS
jgi:hypothetical protein